MIEAQEPQSGSAPFKREKVRSLLPGSLFKLNSASISQTLLLRVTQTKRPAAKNAVTLLSVEREPGTWPALYLQPGVPKPPDFLLSVAPITYQRIVELPRGLRDNLNVVQIVVLALRSRETVIGFNVHLSADGGTTYEPIAAQNHFAIYGKIKVAAYPDTTADIDTTVGATIDLYGFDLDHVVALSDQARDDNTLLLWIDNEILSVGDVVALGAGRYTVYTRRAQHKTLKASHAIDADCWFMFRVDLLRIENANFIAGNALKFKLQPFSELEDYDVALATAINYSISNPPNVAAPAISPGTKNFTGTLVINMVADAGLIVRYRLDGGDVDIQSPEWPKASGVYTTMSITQSANLVVRAFAADGRASDQVLATYTLTGADTSGPVTFSFSGTQNVTGGNLSMLCATPSNVIKYKKNGGSATTYSAAIAIVSNSTGDIIEAWSETSGMNPSAHTFFDNTYDRREPGGGGGGGGREPP